MFSLLFALGLFLYKSDPLEGKIHRKNMYIFTNKGFVLESWVFMLY